MYHLVTHEHWLGRSISPLRVALCVWHDPSRFTPDRFLSPRNEGKQPFTLVGFGGGPRICVGYAFAKMQLAIVVGHLLRHFQVEVVQGQSFVPIAVPTKMPKDGLVVRIAQR